MVALNDLLNKVIGPTKDALTNYGGLLGRSFQNLSRAEQEQLITRYCQILTIGSAVVIATFIYPFLPTLVRVFSAPALVIAAWYLGTKVVSAIMIKRLDKYLK
jgi:hypothetical protein